MVDQKKKKYFINLFTTYFSTLSLCIFSKHKKEKKIYFKKVTGFVPSGLLGRWNLK